MSEISGFDFGKDEIKLTLGEDPGFITLDRREGVLTFQTSLRKLDVRLVEGAKFFLGEAAGYTNCVYVRLEMPPGYGPIRSLGRVPKGNQDAKLFVDVANLCVPQSQPVFRSEADVSATRRKAMRFVLSVLFMALAVGIFYYWFSYRAAVERRASLSAEAKAAYERYFENLTFAPPLYNTTGPRSGNFVSMLASTTIEPPYEITARTFVRVTLRPGRTQDRGDFVRVIEEEIVDLRDPVNDLLQKYLEEGKVREARDCAFALIVFGQDMLILVPAEAFCALQYIETGFDNLKLSLASADDNALIAETAEYTGKLSKTFPSSSGILYGARLEAEIKFGEFAKPLGFVSRPTGDSADPHNYNLMDFVREWERYGKTMSEIEVIFRKPFPEGSEEIDKAEDKFRNLPELFRNNTPDPLRLAESYKKVSELFSNIRLTAGKASGN